MTTNTYINDTASVVALLKGSLAAPAGNGQGGGRPGESVGNNLSFPAVFPETAPVLRGLPDSFTFTTPKYLTGDNTYVYFAQGVTGNQWQAWNKASTGPVFVDWVDIGDALESAPIRLGGNVRLELTLYETLDEATYGSDAKTAFAMTVLGGAKGGGKPTTTGPTESQGARMIQSAWDAWKASNQGPYTGITDSDTELGNGVTYRSQLASVYAATPSGTETASSYMNLAIQKVEGLLDSDTVQQAIAGLAWNGAQWVDANGNDPVAVGTDIFTTAFGPELNIGGKYIMGASGKPFKFTSEGDYLVTFALNNGAKASLDANTRVANDFDPDTLGFQPPDPYEPAAGRETWVVPDSLDANHNGLLVMLVGAPSSVETGE